MDKNFWGPSVWRSIHYTSAGYNPANSFSMKQFINSLPYLLPCEVCQKHLRTNLKNLPLTPEYLNSSTNMFYWSYLLHDTVNQQLRKYRPSYQAVAPSYFHGAVDTHIWGPDMWKMIHSFAASYKPSTINAQAFRQFIYSLPGLLNCQNCKNRMLNVLQILPLDNEHLQHTKKLFLWTYQLHNIINEQLGKYSPNYEKVVNFYFNKKVCKDCNFN